MPYRPSNDPDAGETERETVSGTISRLRLHSRGFLDQSELIAALGIDEEDLPKTGVWA